jgi:hypothetical protein
MISLYIRKVRDGHQYIVMNDCCVKMADGAIKGEHDWPEMLRIIAAQEEGKHEGK